MLLLQIPGFMIGLVLGPLTSRGNWLVEFLYPYGLARWGHLKLLRWGSKTKNGVTLGDPSNQTVLHSRCIEQRTEVVMGRVYIHPLPQLLDNIGYLIVCVPPAPVTEKARSPKDKGKGKPAILGIIVDCGEAEAVIEQIEFIKDVHYHHYNCDIEIAAVLSTHKHHDHTAGNKGLLEHAIIGETLEKIYGGAIEKVPYCNEFVSDGTFIVLPSKGDNDMNSVISIECIATPSHTRGSVVFNLRNKTCSEYLDDESLPGIRDTGVFAYLFTGDTMFSAGGGVTFEADLEFPVDVGVETKSSKSSFKPTGGSLSLERCFAEILRRGIDDCDVFPSADKKLCGAQQMLIFPGHEYTLDLLQRQFQSESVQLRNSSWSRHQPSVFFELAHQFFISGHRRHLPKSTRLLTVPSSMKRELKINPYFRSLKKRGEHLLTAISVWYKHGNRNGTISTINVSETTYLTMPLSRSTDSIYQGNPSLKTPSSDTTWNLSHEDLNKSVFTTVFSRDLEGVIEDLKMGKIEKLVAAHKLSTLSDNLDIPAVQRRPVPNTFPSEKKMYLGLLAMSVLGSQPSGLTNSDSKMMDLALPVESSDYLLISKSRLITSLFRLGLFPNCFNAGDLRSNDLVQMINLLWEQARAEFEDLKLDNEQSDLEVQSEDNDLIELGALKLALYAVPYNKPSWFSKFCMPCNSKASIRHKRSQRRADTMKTKKRSGGELVKHDIAKCPMCCDTMGCPNYPVKPKKEPLDVQILNGSPTRSPNKKHQEAIEMRASKYEQRKTDAALSH